MKMEERERGKLRTREREREGRVLGEDQKVRLRGAASNTVHCREEEGRQTSEGGEAGGRREDSKSCDTGGRGRGRGGTAAGEQHSLKSKRLHLSRHKVVLCVRGAGGPSLWGPTLGALTVGARAEGPLTVGARAGGTSLWGPG